MAISGISAIGLDDNLPFPEIDGYNTPCIYRRKTDGFSLVTTPTPYTGTYCLRIDASTISQNYSFFVGPGANSVAPFSAFVAFYVDGSAQESRLLEVVAFTDLSVYLRLERLSDGKLRLFDGANTTLVTTSASVANQQWHRVEFRVNNAHTSVSFFLDGAQLYSGSFSPYQTTNSLLIRLGGLIGTEATGYVYFSGLCSVSMGEQSDSPYEINDLRIRPLRPASDVQAGTWTGGGGGTTNLYEALNNSPPVGTTAPGTDASQIRSVDSSGDNSTDAYVVDFQTYANAGVVNTSNVIGLTFFVLHGEEINTQTKSIGLWSTANPNYGYLLGETAGGDVGAVGAYPTNWRWATAPIVGFTTPSLQSAPRLELRNTTGTTRAPTICHAIIYVVERIPKPASLICHPPAARMLPLLAI